MSIEDVTRVKVVVQQSIVEGLKEFVGVPNTQANRERIAAMLAEGTQYRFPTGYGTPTMPPSLLVAVDHGDTPLQRCVNRELADIDFSRFPWAIAFRWRWEPSPFAGETDLHLSWVAPALDRETGEKTHVEQQYTVSGRELEQAVVNWQDGPFVRRIVYEKTREFVVHELDECFLVGGRRVFDPHAGR